ncbi:ABC transporter ATP-binding protein [Niveibacterium terrae]|uniref:ABC transporter ATP-binding protein n=1 Tax=Niveibacterium terrae TaxID=3373598 RepID=UPI003A94A4B4
MLKLESLAWRYPGAPAAALDGVSLTIAAGEVLGLLGPNGAGKTTLISLIAGALNAEPGQIVWSGAPRAVGWAPQDFAFYPALTVRENLEVFAGVIGLAGAARRARVAAAIAFGQMGGFAERRARTLSGGMKRRLNLALAVLGDAPLLLLDEPTAGVDPQSRAFLLDAVRQLRDEGRAVLYTSHYMEEIEAVADRVAIIDRGCVCADGTLAEVCAAAGGEAKLQLGSPLPAPLAEEWTRRYGLASLGAQRWTLKLSGPFELAAVLTELAKQGVAVRSASVGEVSLEDAFLKLTQRALRDDA